MENIKAYVIFFMFFALVLVVCIWYLIIKNIVKAFKNANEKHSKEMELMQTQLDYYKSQISENDT